MVTQPRLSLGYRLYFKNPTTMVTAVLSDQRHARLSKLFASITYIRLQTVGNCMANYSDLNFHVELVEFEL